MTETTVQALDLTIVDQKDTLSSGETLGCKSLDNSVIVAVNAKTGTALSIYQIVSSQIVQKSVTVDSTYSFDSCVVSSTSPVEIYVLTSSGGSTKLYALSISSPVNTNQPTISEIDTSDPYIFVGVNPDGEVIVADSTNLTSLAVNSNNMTDVTENWSRDYTEFIGSGVIQRPNVLSLSS